jgi:hypothetical protein
MLHYLGEQGPLVFDQFRMLDLAMPRHRADSQHVTVEADVTEIGNSIKVDEVTWAHYTKIQHRHETLTAC